MLFEWILLKKRSLFVKQIAFNMYGCVTIASECYVLCIFFNEAIRNSALSQNAIQRYKTEIPSVVTGYGEKARHRPDRAIPHVHDRMTDLSIQYRRMCYLTIRNRYAVLRLGSDGHWFISLSYVRKNSRFQQLSISTIHKTPRPIVSGFVSNFIISHNRLRGSHG